MADDVTEFDLIKGVGAAEIPSIYGDSYISGFIEGGEFNALISIKLKDKSKARDIQAGVNLSGNLPGGLGSASGEADVAIKNTMKEVTGETTISVSWSGGGEVKPDSVTEWNMDTLKQAAIAFPDKVALTPQRIYAIVTKYTSLKSFNEKAHAEGSPLKGSALDYDNAGVYTSTLLDAYLYYKSMWKTLQVTASDLEDDLVTLEFTKCHEDKLKVYGDQLKADYDLLLTTYNTDLEAYNKATDKTDRKKPVKPNRPNACQRYQPDIFGLDKAKNDCRLEMIKIVQEVDLITYSPIVAVDPDRKPQFLSPAIFRMLLPISSRKTPGSTTNVPGTTPPTVPPVTVTGSVVSNELYKGYVPSPLLFNQMLTKYAGGLTGILFDSFWAGQIDLGNDDLKFFCALDSEVRPIPSMWTPTEVHYQQDGLGYIYGIGFKYNNGSVKRWGPHPENPWQILPIPAGQKIKAIEVPSQDQYHRVPVPNGFKIQVLQEEPHEYKWLQSNDYPEASNSNKNNTLWSTTYGKFSPWGYSLIGFWGQYGQAINRLGFIWGRD